MSRSARRCCARFARFPSTRFTLRVTHIAPCAAKNEKDAQSTVTLCCRLEDARADVRPGLTGYARISCGGSMVGIVLTKRVMRHLGTEFFWW